jgi:hypothetical protein
MDVVRRVSLLATVSLLGIAVMLGAFDARTAVGADAASSLSRATGYFDSTIVLARSSRPRGPRGDELAIALGYIERLRLGLGSPFRLADEAAHDPRLSNGMGPRVSWAVLGRIRRGDAFDIDASVLDGAGPWGAGGHGATGAAHLALIRHAISSAGDPRAGELAVRLAYQIESAKGSLASSTLYIAMQVAALVRDQAFAVQDVRELLSEAHTANANVLDLLSARRVAHEFLAEQPPLASLSTDLQVEAMKAVPDLVRALDTLDRVVPSSTGTTESAPTIGAAFASRLAALGQELPPTAQVVVTLRSHSLGALQASNEETLAATYASAVIANDSVSRSNALALLSTAVALRSLAQELPWFAGDGGPRISDLTTEFGLAGVTFGRGVPVAWRPLYLFQLQTGLRDMQRVFPAFTANGLHVRFGVEALRDSALAMHDPRTRTLQLSILTSGGTIAHELSHDLDWQTSRLLFAGAGGYSTDRAIAEQRGALSSSLRGLAEARLLRPIGTGVNPPADRPAELFARSADWFIATTLAQQGLSNGYLSAIEDPLLGGYAAGEPTAVGASGARSLTSAIEAMTYLPDSTRLAFESQWSDPRIVDPALLVRRALETPVSWRSAWQWGTGLAGAFPPMQAQLCGGDDDSPAIRARENLLMLAVDARAHGIATRRARYRSTSERPDWANSVLGVAPWSADAGERVVDGLQSAIIAELTAALADQGVVPTAPSIFRASAATCSTSSR